MNNVDRAYNEFLECLHTAITEDDFRRVAERVAHSLGFRWFAYFGRQPHGVNLISSYPKRWTDHYFEEGYDQIDPVLRKPRLANPITLWDGRDPRSANSPKERRMFDDALSFRIRTGLTIRIPAGQNQFAAFTLAVDDRSLGLDRFMESARDLLQMVGINYHAHVTAKIDPLAAERVIPLTQRERQCLAWTSHGKTMQDIAEMLKLSPRGVKFHLDNARQNLSALTLPHAVALALRQGLL
ncbi:autoinducer binding domain-containing protein [Bradyrhizobium sp. CCGUVB23]|uniref:autoinducer binding domain-containing protein n=1 Tax=Bradyrhizobium sp. CCGUVB23 TaxID=2949630 RepID=UPI0020B287A4|nr:autoinducer binding domain-containing protein [Bradyrhizobium sp. CCGUVB23]MCP3468133.1 LuxR family transcriptional regulator [Bradyrhizobium sp. CCGUVB23]